VGRLPEILLAGPPDVAERLGVPVEKREPGALDVDHDAVALSEGVGDIGKLKAEGIRVWFLATLSARASLAQLSPSIIEGNGQSRLEKMARTI
jgi:hypothetical protein